MASPKSEQLLHSSLLLLVAIICFAATFLVAEEAQLRPNVLQQEVEEPSITLRS